MTVCQSIDELRALRRTLSGSVGFAPTMGNIHDGHIACLKSAQRSSDYSVVSIFVNPTQFAPTDDFAKYPRTLDDDLKLLAANGCDAVFVPTVDEMYPASASTKVMAGSMAQGLEGDFRPGHFDGVVTVCLELFQIVQPTNVAFGSKDLQQMRVIQQLIRDFNLPIHLDAVPTIREPNGLALSSRNRYLTPAAKTKTSELNQGLQDTLQLVAAGVAPKAAESKTIAHLTEQGWVVDYVAIRDAMTLQPITNATSEVAVLGAARLDGVRLIDNITANYS
ncbi:MAG: pantoate--beta-alanine ligase [Armatimonadota bacterium]